MKPKTLVFFLAVIFAMMFFLIQQNAFAIAEDVDCFQYYKFQDGIKFEDFRAEKVLYSPEEEVILSYNLVSKMDIPIVEGRIRVQILYNDEKQGEQIIDEFFSHENINLMPQDILEQEIKWKIPSGAKSGEYEAKVYFIVGEMFNLAGLSFVPYGPPGVPGDMTTFNVKNPSAESRIYFDKEETKINNEKYPFSSFLLSRNNSETLNIETKLVNEGNNAKEISLSLLTYEWDDLNERSIQTYTVKRIVPLIANGEAKISYTLPALPSATYEIKFLAEYGEEKSILKLRIPIMGEKGRFIYLALDKFPLKENEKAKIFFCFSNSADYVSNFSGKVNVEVLNSDRQNIFKEESNIEVVGEPLGKVIEFTPSKELTNLFLKANLKDYNGVIHDSVELIYDYSKFLRVPAKFDLILEKDKFNPGDEFIYTIILTDNEGRELEGKVLLYLLDSKGNILFMEEENEIFGSLIDEIDLPDDLGIYTLKARELTRDLETEKDFEITLEKIAVVTTTIPPSEITTTTIIIPEEKIKPSLLDYLIWGIVALGILYLIFFFLQKGRRKKK